MANNFIPGKVLGEIKACQKRDDKEPTNPFYPPDPSIGVRSCTGIKKR